MSIRSLVVVSALAASAFASAAPVPQTCVGPGPCPDFGIEIQHIKQIECGPWPDLPEAFVIKASVPFGHTPLAGERGYPQAEQCDMLRRAVTGE